MKTPQRPENTTVEEEPKTQLQQKLQILEEEWSSFKLHFPDPNPETGLRRRPSPSSTVGPMRVPPECSPRDLISTLQRWQPLMNSDDDVAEESGKLKGKRLFEGSPQPPPLIGAGAVGSYGGRRSVEFARACALIAFIGCLLGTVRRFFSFGFGDEEIVLVPT